MKGQFQFSSAIAELLGCSPQLLLCLCCLFARRQCHQLVSCYTFPLFVRKQFLTFPQFLIHTRILLSNLTNLALFSFQFAPIVSIVRLYIPRIPVNKHLPSKKTKIGNKHREREEQQSQIMGGYLSTFSKLIWAKKEIRILILGLVRDSLDS